MDAVAHDRQTALIGLGEHLRSRGYTFTCVSPATHARVVTRPGHEWARDLAGAFGWSRPFRPGLLPDDLLEALVAADLLAPVDGGWRSRVRVSTLHDERFVHSAYPTDRADAVFFGPDTYRFADAVATHLAAEARPIRRAVDVCCGAGPGAVVVAGARPSAHVLAVDINPTALLYARVNAALAGTEHVETADGDLLSGVEGGLDLVVANPPYLVDPTRRAYRHGGGPLGAELSEAIVDQALPRLAPGGALVLYTGVAVVDGVDPFKDAVSRGVEPPFELSYREVDPDVFGEELLRPPYDQADRIAAVVLTVRRAR